jgi:GNAT superfamily N-acetyltransferase
MTTLAASAEEHLEQGYAATTPAGDNLVLDFARSEAEAFGALVASTGGRTAYDAQHRVHLRDAGLPTPFGNVALLDAPVAERDIDALVARVKDFFHGNPGGPFMVFSPWPIADLSTYGFAPVGHPPLMFRPAGGTSPLAPGLRIERVTHADALADFEQTLIEAYPVAEMQPWARESYLRPAALDTKWQFFVGYADDRAVATAAAYVAPDVTIVELVSARPECRGRGYGAALTAAASVIAPDRPAMLIASDLGRGVYARLGYLPLLRYTLWLGMR